MSIATEITRLRNAKEAIKTSIINKGVAVSDTAKLDEYSSLIDSIESGSGGVKIEEYFGTYTGGPFMNCIIKIPSKNTVNVYDMNYMLSGYPNLIEVPELDASKVVNITNCFINCSKLTIFGGLKNLGQNYSKTETANNSYYTLNLSSCKKLDYESLMNVINGLYDIAARGCNRQSLVLGTANLAKLTQEEINIAINKGWDVT